MLFKQFYDFYALSRIITNLYGLKVTIKHNNNLLIIRGQGRAKLHFLVPKSNQTIINDMSFDQTKTISLESDKMQIDNIKQ